MTNERERFVYMTNMARILRAKELCAKLWRDETGAVSVEYVVVAGVLAVSLIPAAAALADSARIWFWQKIIRITLY